MHDLDARRRAIAARNALNGVVRSDGSGIDQYASANFTSGGSVIVALGVQPARVATVVADRESATHASAIAAYFASATRRDVDERVRPQRRADFVERDARDGEIGEERRDRAR